MKLLLALILTFIFNTCYAEIDSFYNDFDNSTNTYSYFKEGQNENTTKEIVLKKIHTSSNDEYYFFFSKRYTSGRRYIALENVKLKVDDNIISPETRITDSAVGSTYSLNLTPFIAQIQNSNSITIQIPSYTKEKQQVRYTYYELDKNILSEWKQVINM